MYVSFDEVKQLTTLQVVAEWLGLKPVSNRMQCPVNQGEKRELVITPSKGLFYCFGCKEGGDLIKLVSHVNQIPQKHAALAIQKQFHGYEPAKKGLPPDGLQDLQYQHEWVQELGFSPERAQELGIGYRKGGILPKMLLFPIRDPAGRLLGYMAWSPEKGLKAANSLVK